MWQVRLLLGCVLLLAAAFNRDPFFAVAQLLLAAAIVYHLAGGFAPLRAAMRLLRWLVLPILLLHMLLTPGAMVFPSLPLPISREGLERGLWLSLHLMEMFVAAMALSRLLLWSEWLQWLAAWPGIGPRLVIDARLFMLMQRDARLLIERQRRRWRAHRFDLVLLARLLAETLQQMLARSELQAMRLWRHWHSPRLQALLAGEKGARPHAGITFGVACLILLLAYRIVGFFV